MSTSIKTYFANLTSSNIRNGVNVGGIVGSYKYNFILKDLGDNVISIGAKTSDSITVPFTEIPSLKKILAVKVQEFILLNYAATAVPGATLLGSSVSKELEEEDGTSYVQIQVNNGNYVLFGYNAHTYSEQFGFYGLQALFAVDS